MTAEDSPVKQDTNWFPVQITEFLVISIINAITITAFARIRHLRKRSTYLIINLTVADLLIGTVTGPLYVYHKGVEKHELTYPGFFFLDLSTNFSNSFPVESFHNFLRATTCYTFPLQALLNKKAVLF